MKRLVAEILNDWYLDALYPKSGMEAVQKDLLDRGFRLYVLSNAGYSFHKFSYKSNISTASAASWCRPRSG